jgi:hypothetical protein
MPKSRGVFAFLRGVRDALRKRGARSNSNKLIENAPANGTTTTTTTGSTADVVGINNNNSNNTSPSTSTSSLLIQSNNNTSTIRSSSPAVVVSNVITNNNTSSSSTKTRSSPMNRKIERVIGKMDEKEMSFVSDYISITLLAKTKLHPPELMRVVASFLWEESYAPIEAVDHQNRLMTRNTRVFLDATMSNTAISTRWNKFALHVPISDDVGMLWKLVQRVHTWKKTWVHSSGDLFCGTCAGTTCTSIRTTAEGFITEFESLPTRIVVFPQDQLDFAKDKIWRRNNAKFDSTTFDQILLTLMCTFTSTESYRKFALSCHPTIPLEL